MGRMATLRPMKSRLGGVIAAGMAAALVLAGCAGEEGGGGDEGGGGEGGTVTIGFMGDLTGEASAIVIPPRNGAKLAIDEYNATNPDTKIELKEYDTQAKEDQAVNLTREATTDDKIVGLIGPAFSGESKAAGGVLERAKVPSVSPSATNPGLAENGWKYWHRVVANDADQGPGIVEFLINAKSPKKAFVVSDEQEYSVGIKESVQAAFEAEGVAVEADQFEKDESDLSSTVGKIKAADPDVIFFGGYYAQAGRLLKQLRDGGVDATFASGDGSYDAQLIKAAGADAAEGAVLGCPCLVEPDSEFATKYKEATKSDPAIYSTEGYDAATAFIEAIKAGNTTTEDINEFLKTIDVEGVSKQIKFKENGEPEVNDIFIYQVVDGALKPLGPSAEAKLEG
jgi:branched-chain amino acid transport system substrate-binding protein